MELLMNPLSPAQAARVLDVTPSRIRQMMQSGALEYVRTPLGRLVDSAAVERLRLERERQGQSRILVGV